MTATGTASGRRPARALLLVPAAGLGLVLLTACGSSGSSSASASASPSAAASASGGNAAMSAYRTCLQQHGVNMPTGRGSGRPRRSGAPTDGGSGAPGGGYGSYPSGKPTNFVPRSADPSMAAAQQACASLRPQRTGAPGGGGGGKSAQAAFVSCLKDHNVTLPAGGINALDKSDPNVATALNVCDALLPSSAPSAGASPAATSAPSS